MVFIMKAIFLLALQLLKGDAFLFPVVYRQEPCPTACPPPVLPFLPPPPCQQTCGVPAPAPAPVAPVVPLPPITTVSSTNYGGPFAYPSSVPSLPNVPPSPPLFPSTVLPEMTLSTLPPLVPLPTPGYAQTIPAPLPPPPTLVPLSYPNSPLTAPLPPSFTEIEPKPASPFQSAYVEELAPTLLPPPAQDYKTKYSKERVFFEGDSSSNSKESLTEYDESGVAAPPAPPPSGQIAVPFQLPGYMPAIQSPYETTYPPADQDDRIYAKDGEVKHSSGLTSATEYNPYFDGAHAPGHQTFENFDKRNALLKRYKSAKQHSSNTVQKTTTTCNSEKLARVMAKAISGDVAVAKKLVQKATEVAFDGSKFDVFCANGEFSYSIHSRKYCEVTKDEVTCFAFR